MREHGLEPDAHIREGRRRQGCRDSTWRAAGQQRGQRGNGLPLDRLKTQNTFMLWNDKVPPILYSAKPAAFALLLNAHPVHGARTPVEGWVRVHGDARGPRRRCGEVEARVPRRRRRRDGEA